MPTTTTRDKDILFWQENKEMGAPEPAILIQAYSDSICLETAEGLVNHIYHIYSKLKNG